MSKNQLSIFSTSNLNFKANSTNNEHTTILKARRRPGNRHASRTNHKSPLSSHTRRRQHHKNHQRPIANRRSHHRRVGSLNGDGFSAIGVGGSGGIELSMSNTKLNELSNNSPDDNEGDTIQIIKNEFNKHTDNNNFDFRNSLFHNGDNVNINNLGSGTVIAKQRVQATNGGNVDFSRNMITNSIQRNSLNVVSNSGNVVGNRFNSGNIIGSNSGNKIPLRNFSQK